MSRKNKDEEFNTTNEPEDRRETSAPLDETFIDKKVEQPAEPVLGGKIVGGHPSEMPDAEPPVSDGATQCVVIENETDKPKWVQFSENKHKNVHFANANGAVSCVWFGDEEPDARFTDGQGVGKKGLKIEEAGVPVWGLLAAKSKVLVIRGDGKLSTVA